MTDEGIARYAHHILRAYAQSRGIWAVPVWEALPSQTKDQLVSLVQQTIVDPVNAVREIPCYYGENRGGDKLRETRTRSMLFKEAVTRLSEMLK
jgi:hypothetical protein